MKKGFTFIEFLVTVAVVGILAAIIIPMVRTSGCGVNEDKLWANIEKALQQDSSNLPIPVIKDISRLIRKGNAKVKQPYVTDALLVTCAKYLNDNGEWTDRDKVRVVYDTIKSVKSDLVIESLVRQVRKPEGRLHVLFLGVKLGIPGSQERLVAVLMQHGDKAMAEDFLNSGSQDLHEGGRKWANEHGYTIMTGMGSHRVGWGRF